MHKILVIDDCHDICNLMEMIFLPEGYEVCLAHNGLEAMEFLNNEMHPDLIFLDHDMDEMNGPEFLLELRKIFPNNKIPIVMVTSREIKDDHVMQVREVFKKPLTMDALIPLAKKHINPGC